MSALNLRSLDENKHILLFNDLIRLVTSIIRDRHKGHAKVEAAITTWETLSGFSYMAGIDLISDQILTKPILCNEIMMLNIDFFQTQDNLAQYDKGEWTKKFFGLWINEPKGFQIRILKMLKKLVMIANSYKNKFTSE